MTDPHDRGPDGRPSDIASGLGVPAWLGASITHCGRCGTALTFGPVPGEERERLVCPSCGQIAYVTRAWS